MQYTYVTQEANQENTNFSSEQLYYHTHHKSVASVYITISRKG